MKAILEFALPDDRYEFRAAVAGPRLLSNLEDIKELIRLHMKHGDPNDSGTRIEEIREMVYDALLEFAE